jgi:hypothetical protein
MYELLKTFKLGIASWLDFLRVNDLTMFQVVSVLFLEFIIRLSYYEHLASIIFLDFWTRLYSKPYNNFLY